MKPSGRNKLSPRYALLASDFEENEAHRRSAKCQVFLGKNKPVAESNGEKNVIMGTNTNLVMMFTNEVDRRKDRLSRIIRSSRHIDDDDRMVSFW